MSPCRLTRTCPVQENKYTSRRSTSTSHCFRSDVRQRHSISRLLTADRAQIHGPLSALRLGWKKEKSRGERDWADGRDGEKSARKAGREGDGGWRMTDIPLTPAAPGLWVGGWQRHRVAEDLLTSHFSWMELSDAGRTQLKEQQEEVEPSAQTQRGGAKRDEEERRRGRGGGGGGMYFKAAPAANSRLGCGGVSVSRTDCFCTRENPFVPNQFFPCQQYQHPTYDCTLYPVF